MEGCMEKFSKKFLPVLRAAVAQELAFEGLTQTQIAKKMHITQSAVSQYMRNVRGKGSLEDNKIREEARKIAKILSTKNMDADELYSRYMLSFVTLCSDCLPSWFCQEIKQILEKRGYRQ